MLASLREFFLLERARARAAARAPAGGAALRFRAAARRRRHASAVLVGRDVAVAALVLDREALLLEARARVHDDATDEVALAAIASSIDASAPKKRAPLRRAFDALTAPGPLALDELDPVKLAALRDDVGDLLMWLDDDDTDAPSPSRLVRTRALRIGGLVVALALLVRVVGGVLFAPPNRALHKPVTASSHFPDTPEASGLTDGNRTGLGVHTTVENAASVTVDLGLTYKLRKIRVYNRTDCCGDEGLPLIVEASVPNDPAPFVAKRETHFDVWEIDVDGHAATTIKLKAGKHPGYVALAELEVVGDR